MRPGPRLRHAARRTDSIVAVASVALPVAVSTVLGFFWLIEHDWFLIFVLASAALGLLSLGVRWIGRRRLAREIGRDGAVLEDLQAREGPAIAASPEWGEAETEAYHRSCKRIDSLTREAQDWEGLLPWVQEELARIATDMGKRERLDFSLPEALLLVERASGRYRDWLRRNLPLADTIKLRQAVWLVNNQDKLNTAWSLGYGLWRVARFARNPVRGAAREAEGLFTESNSSWLGGQMVSVLQAILLEEIAYAAVELYSGRLRFSEAELSGLAGKAGRRDRARLAAEDAPVRILLVGQVSAGKSTLVNALLAEERSETDMPATTARHAGYEITLGDIPCHLIDAPGLDGSPEGQAQALAEMAEADLVLWALRSDRPARAPDARLWQAFREDIADRPQWRAPHVIALATAADRVMPGWPFPDHDVSRAALARLGEALEAIRRDLPGLDPLPVVALSPEWNIGRLREVILDQLPAALATQRQRLRLEGASQERGIWSETKRAGRGLVSSGRGLGRRIADRWGGENGKKERDEEG